MYVLSQLEGHLEADGPPASMDEEESTNEDTTDEVSLTINETVSIIALLTELTK